MKRAAIYARVSTHNGQNPEMQLNEVRAYCERRQWVVAGEYVDTGISGSKEHRTALDRLLRIAANEGSTLWLCTVTTALPEVSDSWLMRWTSSGPWESIL